MINIIKNNKVTNLCMLALTCSLLFKPVSAADSYSVIYLGTLGGSSSKAFDINNLGVIVGNSSTPNDEELHAVYWENGVINDLGTLGGTISTAYSISDTGYAAGISLTKDNLEAHATVWGFGFMHNLSNDKEDVGSTAYAINQSGQVVGNSREGKNNANATEWSWSLPSINHSSFPGGKFSYANGINDSGQIVGNSGSPLSDARIATLWDVDGNTINLGTLGGSDSFAKDINEAGQIVGASLIKDDITTHATLWDNHIPSSLGALPDGNYSVAFDINNRSQIVGVSICQFFLTCATLWEDNTIVDLNIFLDERLKELGWLLYFAQAINDNGWIVGTALNYFTGEEQAVVLIPD